MARRREGLPLSGAALSLILAACSAPTPNVDVPLDHPGNARAHEATFVPAQDPFADVVVVKPAPPAAAEHGATHGSPTTAPMQGGEEPAAATPGHRQHSGHP